MYVFWSFPHGIVTALFDAEATFTLENVWINYCITDVCCDVSWFVTRHAGEKEMMMMLLLMMAMAMTMANDNDDNDV